MRVNFNEFIDMIKDKKIVDCYRGNTKEDKQETRGLSEYGIQQLKETKTIDITNIETVDVNLDYGSAWFVLELVDGTKILFNGSEWNTIEVIKK